IPGGGFSGGPGGGVAGGPNQAKEVTLPDVEPMWVYAYIEVKVKPQYIPGTQTMDAMKIEHRFTTKQGVLIPYPTKDKPLPYIQVGFFEGLSVSKRFEHKVKNELPKEGKVSDVESAKQK